MSYNVVLARRIIEAIGTLPFFNEKKMFGGVAFLLQGNMACGVHGEDLIVRVGPARYAEALAEPHTKPFDLTGKPMAGWITVGPEGYETDEGLKYWINQGIEFASSLPAK